MSTLEITYEIIAPIFLVVGCAALVDRVFNVEPSGLSRMVIYLFTPFLVFDGMANTELKAGEAGQLIGTALGMSLGVALVAWLVARVAGYDRQLESAFVLTATVINAGNYGLPLNRLAFGEAGEERALVFFVVTVVVTNTLGVYLASRGSASGREALLNVFKVPLPYAALLGVLVNVGDVTLPGPVAEASSIIAQAAIPGMLGVLGIQLSRTSLQHVRDKLRPVLIASGLRLVVAPAIALGFVVALGMSGLTRDVSLVQSAMPTAVIGGVLAAEFGSDTEFVTATILISTLASMATLSLLLSWLL